MITCKYTLRGARVGDKKRYMEGEHACDLLIVSMSINIFRIKVCEDGEHGCDIVGA